MQSPFSEKSNFSSTASSVGAIGAVEKLCVTHQTPDTKAIHSTETCKPPPGPTHPHPPPIPPQALAAALKLRPDRKLVISERSNFPTDLYMIEGLVSLLDDSYTLRLVDNYHLPSSIDSSVAAVVVTHVNYRTGRMLDMASISAAIQGVGALAIWDLAHSAGAMPLHLSAANVDFAVGCGYKYLNGGPGAPAFIYVAKCIRMEV